MVSGSAHLEPSLFGATLGPSGHGDEHHHQSAGFGAMYTTLTQPPVTSAMTFTKPPPISVGLDDSVPGDRRFIPLPNSAIPNFDFPKFDGSNPRLWIKNCETYFKVYAVNSYLWGRIATMNLTGSTALWLQTVISTVCSLPWPEFAATVCTKFNRDEHNHLHRQFFHIRQLTNVHEYIEHFNDLVHQILAHDQIFLCLSSPIGLLMVLGRILSR